MNEALHRESDRDEPSTYEVWIACGLRMVRWSDKGGVPGPMSKEKAERYVEAFADRAGVRAEVREMRA